MKATVTLEFDSLEELRQHFSTESSAESPAEPAKKPTKKKRGRPKKEDPPAEPEPPVEEQAAEPTNGVLSREDVRELAITVSKEKSADFVRETLKEYGVKHINELEETQFVDFAADLQRD